jgi:hypothetical protein
MVLEPSIGRMENHGQVTGNLARWMVLVLSTWKEIYIKGNGKKVNEYDG